jgi:hypothetical protein
MIVCGYPSTVCGLLDGDSYFTGAALGVAA